MNDGTSWTYGQNFICIANLTFFTEKFTFISKLFATMDSVSKKSQKGSGDKLTTLPVQGTSKISTVKERSCHIANEHFKITR